MCSNIRSVLLADPPAIKVANESSMFPAGIGHLDSGLACPYIVSFLAVAMVAHCLNLHHCSKLGYFNKSTWHFTSWTIAKQFHELWKEDNKLWLFPQIIIFDMDSI